MRIALTLRGVALILTAGAWISACQCGLAPNASDGGDGDAGPSDSGAADANTPPDSGVADAGTTDSGSADSGSADAGDAGPYISGLRVDGGSLVDDLGRPVRLIGVNLGGSEEACTVNLGAFVVPLDAAHVQATIGALQSWNINAVRIPLNEDCWLGINKMPAGSSGANYRDPVNFAVRALRQAGIYVVLDLHHNAPANDGSYTQQIMADRDHGLDYWASVASTFNGANGPIEQGVIFDLYNEPEIGVHTRDNAPTDTLPDGGAALGDDRWWCWEHGGCTCYFVRGAKPAPDGGPHLEAWIMAGMQEMLDVVRLDAGAPNVAILGGLGAASNLSGWLAYEPHDALGQLAVSYHAYPGDLLVVGPLFDAGVPVVAGELGEADGNDHGILPFMQGVDPLGGSYLAWIWKVDATTPYELITDYVTAAPTPYGSGIQQHYLGH